MTLCPVARLLMRHLRKRNLVYSPSSASLLVPTQNRDRKRTFDQLVFQLLPLQLANHDLPYEIAMFDVDLAQAGLERADLRRQLRVRPSQRLEFGGMGVLLPALRLPFFAELVLCASKVSGGRGEREGGVRA